MIDKEFASQRINELTMKYKKASQTEKIRIKYELAEAFSALYENQPTGFKEFTDADRISEMTTLLYGLDKHDGTCILDTFVGGNFVGYMNQSIKNNFLQKLKKTKKDGGTEVTSDTPDTDDSISNIEEIEQLKGFLAVLLLAKFDEHRSSKENNEDRKLYTQLFFTEQFTSFCKILFYQSDDYPLKDMLMNRETMLFETISKSFLDHVMEEVCRYISEVADCEYKQKKCFGIKQSPEERIKPEFDAKVFITYFASVLNRKISNSVITYQRRYYKELMVKMLK